MVIDWRQQIEECVRYTKVIPTFHASMVEQHYQQILIVKKLLSMKYSSAQILTWFMLAEENCSKTIEDIEVLIKASKHRRWPKNHNFKIYITAKEIEYIQKLKTSKECKSFLLATVAYAKMMNIRKKKATFNLRERAYIYYLATGKDNYNVGAQRHTYIKKFIMEMEKKREIKIDIKQTRYKDHSNSGHIIKNITNVVFNAKWVDWDATEGYELTDLDIQMKILCDQCFENDILICPNCGKEFLKTNQTQRLLCSSCQKDKTLMKKREYARKHYGYKTQRKVWSAEDNELLKNIYSQTSVKELSSVLQKSFPDRDLKSILNHANYLGIKKYEKNKVSEK